MNRNASNSALIGKLNLLITAVKKRAAGKEMTLGGITIAAADLITVLEAIVARLQNANVTHTRWIAAVAAVRDNHVQDTKVVTDLLDWARVMFGNDPEALGEFGLKKRTRTRKARSAQEQVNVNAKSIATRDARHTMGPRQKAKIHGVVAPKSTEPAAPVAAPASAATPDATKK
jgi:hypothetical protein